MGFGRRATNHQPTSAQRGRQRGLISLAAAIATLLLIAACSGPETGANVNPTSTATATATSVPTATPTSTPTTPPTATLTPTRAATPSPTLIASPTANASPSVASGSPTSASQQLKNELPKLADLPAGGYTISAEGTRTAQELANAYADNAAHLQRLTDWGFKTHVYREFAHTATGADDPLPFDVLCTVNVYGSPDKAQLAIEFLKKLDLSQGKQEVDAPTIGDTAVALTVPTADGTPTASLYVRKGDSVYVYFAQGGKPLDTVTAIAQKVFAR